MNNIFTLDWELFLWLNRLHHPWADVAMRYITATWPWLPLYALVIGWLYWRFAKKALGWLLLVAASVATTDQLSSSIMKPWVGRLRPCYQPELADQVHTIAGCGGQFGFFSAHAANTFALAMLVYLASRGLPEHRALSWGLFGWAALVSYSRIYAGVHYPTDVLFGALCGSLVAWLWHKLVATYRPDML